MARSETHSDDTGDAADESTSQVGSASAAGDFGGDDTGVIRPGTGVVRPNAGVVRPGAEADRPGTGVVRPGTDVVRPGTGVVAPADAGAAKARASVPEVETPLEPIHVVLPVIPVIPAKQSFLDRLVAPKKPKKKPAESAPEEPPEADGPADEPTSGPALSSPATRPGPSLSGPPPSSAAPSGPSATPAVPVVPGTTGSTGGAAPATPPTVGRPPRLTTPTPSVRPPGPSTNSPALGPSTSSAAAPPMTPPTTPHRPPTAPPSGGAAPPTRPVTSSPAGSPAHGARPAQPTVAQPPVVHPPTRPAQPAGPTSSPRTVEPPAGPRHPPANPVGRAMALPDTAPRRSTHVVPTDGRSRWDGYDEPQRQPRRRSEPEPIARRRRRPGITIAGCLVLAVLAVAGGAGTAEMVQPTKPRWLAGDQSGAGVPVLTPIASDRPVPSAASLAAVLAGPLADSHLGPRVAASVVDVATGEQLLDHGSAMPATPASTAKLVTAAAVLHARGPDYRIPTRVVAGSEPGEVVLVGGGDPTLAAGATGTYPGAARLDRLAAQVLKASGDVAPQRVIIDTSLYEGSTTGPGWNPIDLNGGFVAHVTALMTDGARRNPRKTGSPSARHGQPDVAAGQLFAKALGLPASAVSQGTAQQGAQQLGEVNSPPLSRLVEIMLSDSDNVIAEALFRQVALAHSPTASFQTSADATRDALRDLEIPTDEFGLVDGSGMSHLNKVSARMLTAIITAAGSNDRFTLRSVLSGLPVAAYSGTLADRFRTSAGPDAHAAAGVVRAKTGTLDGVNALAGLVLDADGRLLAFALVADATPNESDAEHALDRVAAAVAACGCQ